MVLLVLAGLILPEDLADKVRMALMVRMIIPGGGMEGLAEGLVSMGGMAILADMARRLGFILRQVFGMRPLQAAPLDRQFRVIHILHGWRLALDMGQFINLRGKI